MTLFLLAIEKNTEEKGFLYATQNGSPEVHVGAMLARPTHPLAERVAATRGGGANAGLPRAASGEPELPERARRTAARTKPPGQPSAPAVGRAKSGPASSRRLTRCSRPRSWGNSKAIA